MLMGRKLLYIWSFRPINKVLVWGVLEMTSDPLAPAVNGQSGFRWWRLSP